MAEESQASSCPKCTGEMEEGFVVDFGDGVKKRVGSWVAGAPESGFFGGLKLGDRERRQIHTLRCVRCGFLESYAIEPYDN